MRFSPRLPLAAVVALTFALSACSGGGEPEEQSAPASADSASTVDSATVDDAVELCPSAEDPVDVVALWSGPLVVMDESNDPAMFTFPFTNALEEVVTIVEEDSEAAPCTGQSELLDTAQEWSDLVTMLADENRLPSEAELQTVADAGNLWLDTIDDTTLEFTTDPESSEMLN